MNTKDLGEDGAFFLYLVPIVASIAYGIYEWYLLGRSSGSMPSDAYLIVSKDPYLFLLSVCAICAAIVIEVRSSAFGERQNIVSANVTRLQVLAITVLIISYAAALSVAGYGDLVGGLANFLTGRYALIYAFFLLGMSILIGSRQFLGKMGGGFFSEFIGLILIAISPVVLYAGPRAHLDFTESGIAAIIVFVIGLILFASKGLFFGRKTQKQNQLISKTAQKE